MRVCVVYDCLFPHTVGGAERWYRNVAERLRDEGHEVTYLTLRQWDGDHGVEGVDVRAVGPRLSLYTETGRRRIGPPLVFGMGVFAHLLRHRSVYDVVHTASFPYFSLLAAGLLRRWGGYRIVADWHEVWTLGYWREYLGAAGGRVGWAVQRLCARVPQRAFCFSQLHAGRLRAEGVRGPVEVLEGEYAGSLEARPPRPASDVVVFAGRHIPEKRVPALVPAIARARRTAPELTAAIYGDGPEREKVKQAIAEASLDAVVDLPGFVSAEEIDEAIANALCMVLPSQREGYGMVVVEASARGTPSVVVAGPDNAATELVEEGVNGFIARSASPEDLADAILRVRAAGPALRDATTRWFAANARRLSLEGSLERVAAAYGGAP